MGLEPTTGLTVTRFRDEALIQPVLLQPKAGEPRLERGVTGLESVGLPLTDSPKNAGGKTRTSEASNGRRFTICWDCRYPTPAKEGNSIVKERKPGLEDRELKIRGWQSSICDPRLSGIGLRSLESSLAGFSFRIFGSGGTAPAELRQTTQIDKAL